MLPSRETRFSSIPIYFFGLLPKQRQLFSAKLLRFLISMSNMDLPIQSVVLVPYGNSKGVLTKDRVPNLLSLSVRKQQPYTDLTSVACKRDTEISVTRTWASCPRPMYSWRVSFMLTTWITLLVFELIDSSTMYQASISWPVSPSYSGCGVSYSIILSKFLPSKLLVS